MNEEGYTLQELSERAGIEPRTIRSYISKGLLSGPDSMGRNARYSESHLERLQQIRRLREYFGLSLSDIRRKLLGSDEYEILANMKERTESTTEAPPEIHESVLPDYADPMSLSRRRRRREPPGEMHMSDPWPSYNEPLTPLESLVEILREAAGSRRASRPPRAETVHRVEITPDITLELRGEYADDELALIEQAAGLMREILLGGYGPKP